METTTPAMNNKFQYQESETKDKNFKLVTTKRKRLFDGSVDASSEEEVSHSNKKVKAPVHQSQNILKAFQSKEYERCLKMIDTIKNNREIFEANGSQYKIIMAACWTMLEINSETVYKMLKEVVEKEPKNSFAYYGLGLHQYRQGELNECMESFRIAIDLNPSGAMKRAMEFKAKAKSLMDLICNGKSKIFILFYLNLHLFIFLISKRSVRDEQLCTCSADVERSYRHRPGESKNGQNYHRHSKSLCQGFVGKIGARDRERISRQTQGS
jgi:tetratricopeptide (TPR) repeat protein